MTPWTGRLLVANVVVYAVTGLIEPQLTGSMGLMRELSLIPALLPSRPWTALTYMFLHAGIWHLVFNMIVLYFFGPRLEVRLGGTHFLVLYVVAGLTAALVSWAATPAARIVGASGAVFGVLLGFARYWPRDRILIWGVLPIEARWLVAITAVLALAFGFGGGESNIAHFAHLGGFLGGWTYLAVYDRRRGRTGPLKRALEEQRKRVSRPGRSEVRRWREIDASDLHEVNRENLDRIRAKIEEDGPGSLSRQERQFLERLVRRQEGD